MALDWKGYLIVEWALIGVCLVVTCTRLAVRPWKIMWAFWLSEVFLILSFFMFLVLVVGDTYSFTKNRAGFKSYGTAEFQQWIFAGSIIFDLCLYVPRFSLLAFYYELFPLSEEILRKCLFGAIFYTLAAFLATAFEDIFWCGSDLSQNWLHNTNCSLFSSYPKVNLYINWSLGITAEILVFALPFGMLRRLKKTPRREKIGMMGIFAINILSIIASVARFTSSALYLNPTDTYIIGSTEIAVQIVAVALPALRPLLKFAKRFPGYLDSRVSGTIRSDKLRGSNSTGPSTRGSGAASRNMDNYDLPDINAL